MKAVTHVYMQKGVNDVFKSEEPTSATPQPVSHPIPARSEEYLLLDMCPIRAVSASVLQHPAN